MFGSYLGKKEIVGLMVNHPLTIKLYSEKKIKFIKKYGHIIFKLFGYPLAVVARQRARIIIKYLDPVKDERILDAGCGVGYFSFELATKFCCKVDGIDIDAEDIILANQIAEKMNVSGLTFNISSISNLKFQDQTFDKIILIDVLASLPDEKSALNEIHRVLKPNGFLILSTPHVDTTCEYNKRKPKDYGSNKKLDINGGKLRNGHSFEGLANILKNEGFEIMEHKYFVKKFTIEVNSPLFLLAYPFSMLDNLLGGKGKGIVVKAKKL